MTFKPLWIACCAALLLTAGCDPAGPGASGTIFASADAGVAFSSLQIRACPSSAFSGTACDGGLSSSVALDGGLPVGYLVNDIIGVTREKDWNVIAWSAPAGVPEIANGPAAGDWFGTTAFTVASCDATVSVAAPDFCGVTSGVDVTIDRQLP